DSDQGAIGQQNQVARGSAFGFATFGLLQPLSLARVRHQHTHHPVGSVSVGGGAEHMLPSLRICRGSASLLGSGRTFQTGESVAMDWTAGSMNLSNFVGGLEQGDDKKRSDQKGDTDHVEPVAGQTIAYAVVTVLPATSGTLAGPVKETAGAPERLTTGDLSRL